MILKNIKLHPFAGIRDKEIHFHSGLNIISGPNEAGKSTLIRALLFGLFVPTNIKGVGGENLLKDYLPVNPASDIISIDLEFTCDGKIYVLKKKWGGTKSSELRSSDGKVVTDPESVQKELLKLLKNNEATWRNVLVADQAKLSGIITSIGTNNDISSSFSDMLRSAVMMQGGVSPDKLRNELKIRIGNLLGRWDINSGRPEINYKGQGDYDFQWIKEVGLILAEYYKVKKCEAQIKERGEYDLELDRLAKEIENVNKLIIPLESFIETNEPIISDVRSRQILDAKYELSKNKFEELGNDSISWNQKEAAKKVTVQQLVPLNIEIVELETELTAAEKKKDSVAKKHQLANIDEIQREIEKVDLEGKRIKVVNEQDYDNAEDYNKKIAETRLHLEAQKLKISLIANNSFTAEIISGLDPAEQLSLSKDQSWDTSANSRFILKTNDLTLKVESGEIDIEELSGQFKIAEKSLNEILKKYGVNDLASLQTLKQLYINHQNKLKEKKQLLQGALKGIELEKLKKELNEVDNLPQTRDIDTINKILDQKKSVRTTNVDEERRLTQEINNLLTKYESLQMLDAKRIDELGKKKDIERQFNALRPLPEGVESAEIFIKKFDDSKREYNEKIQIHQDLLSTKKVHEREEPEKTKNELEGELESCKKNFEYYVVQAKAYLKINEKLLSILDGFDTDAFAPYYHKTNQYLSQLTSGKYNKVDMDELTPRSISGNAKELGTQLLSYGTSDALALALRLSMADYFLKDEKGFIVLDDPLTDLDPERQQFAAECLEKYATEKQVLLFSCHKSNADLFNGNKIELKN